MVSEERHLLVIDDDDRIRTLLRKFLQNKGYRVTTAADALEGRALLRNFVFDLIVLDVMMPGEDGFVFTRHARKTSCDTPIIMLTARADVEDRLNGFSMGADDYLIKPFDPRELLLRIKSIFKRTEASSALSQLTREIFKFGPFAFNSIELELFRNGEVVQTATYEKQILSQLCKMNNRVVSRAVLCQVSEAPLGERTIDVYISRLRRKIEPDASSPAYLQTVRGVGYCLRVDDDL